MGRTGRRVVAVLAVVLGMVMTGSAQASPLHHKARWHAVKLTADRQERTWISPHYWSAAFRDVRVSLYAKGHAVPQLSLSGTTQGAFYYGNGLVAKAVVWRPRAFEFKQPIRVRYQAEKSPRPITIRWRVAKPGDTPK